MIAGFPRILCPLLAAVILCLPPAVFWPVGDAGGQPLSQDPLSCQDGVAPGSQVVPGLLSNLIPTLNTQWATQAPKNIDPYPWYDVTKPPNPLPLLDLTQDNAVQIPGFCNSDIDKFCLSKGWLECSSGHINLQLNSLKGLGGQQFQFGSAIPTRFKNVAAHSDRGPDGSKITDGVFAPEGHGNDPAYSIVLAHSANDPRSALVIDLGAPFTVCGDPRNGCHSGPIIQADNDDVYQIDYSTDGVNWTINFGQFPTCCDSGLRTRALASRSAPYPNFTARYVRVYAHSGGAHFSVSELQLWDTSSPPNLISVGKPTVGARPYVITDGVFCKGCSAGDSQIAVVLNHLTGPTPALVVDLRDSQGNPRVICGSGPLCGTTGSGPLIEADNDDVYGFDYSTDGRNWTTYPGTFPKCCDSGEQKRTTQGPNFTASYVRVYALSGGATFAVSELQFWDTSGKLISVNTPTYGPEPLVTNGEFAPEGTSSTDTRYAFILPPCQKEKGGGGTLASSVCPTASAQTPALLIDLTATFPISSLVLQADHAQQFLVESSIKGPRKNNFIVSGATHTSHLASRSFTSLAA